MVLGGIVKKPGGKYYRQRLASPGRFQKGSFRTKDIGHGHKLIVGRLKGSTKTTGQSLLHPEKPAGKVGFDFRPDTKRGMQHRSLGENVYGFDARKLYVVRYRDQRTNKIVPSDPIVADSVHEARSIMERQLYPHEIVTSVKRFHPPGCNCPFHGGHPGRKGGVGYNLKGIGRGTFPTPRRATL